MKTIPLRQLVRQPTHVKRWTRAGETVRVTDNGRPLWTVRAADPPEVQPGREQAIDEVLQETLGTTAGGISAASLLEESRR
ncbi:MAG: hypothetical protein KDM81_01950 [Verrucomicrobiae bacterium]|nr:hypothetical protein [Verrucomicrobiae bacterium]MCP5524763.1 hypothetical protein [Verrucomicrobiales bacterium]